MAQPGVSRVQYVIDPKLSQFNVQAFANGMISVVAHSPKIAIREWTAETRFASESLADASLTVKGKTASFEVLDELREDDRKLIHRIMREEVLETSRYPEFAFTSTNVDLQKQKESVFRVAITGRLTLHGITNDHSFFAHVAFGVDSFRAYGDFTILQTHYEIKIASIAGGTLKLQDELKCSFYVVGKKS